MNHSYAPILSVKSLFIGKIGIETYLTISRINAAFWAINNSIGGVQDAIFPVSGSAAPT